MRRLSSAADGNDEAVAADGDEIFLRCAVAGELAQRGAEAFFNEALLALLIAADAAELGRCIVGEGAVGLDFALDGFGERAEAGGERGGERGEAGELAGEARGGRLEQRLPGGYVVGQAGDGLEFVGFKGCAGDLRLGGELRGVEEAAEGDGDLLGEKRRSSPVSWCWRVIQASSVEGRRSRMAWRPTGDAAKPATRASSGSHSRAAKSTCSTGDGMGSRRGMASRNYSSVPGELGLHGGADCLMRLSSAAWNWMECWKRARMLGRWLCFRWTSSTFLFQPERLPFRTRMRLRTLALGDLLA